jgi:PPK2 family polyphosphate:nucleotide phosphotransferase
MVDSRESQSTKLLSEVRRLAARHRITRGAGLRLAAIDTDAPSAWDKATAKDLLARATDALSDLQEKLYAQDRWAVLAVFQAPDAAGKDSTIKRVMSGVNPQGCEVQSFKRPTTLELDHDFLWRCARVLPERGRIGVFNRSYYEEVLVVRVHPAILAGQKIPPGLVTKTIWRERLDDIAAFESYLARNGVVILKFFLHVSKEEQRKRFLERLDEPDKNWKFSAADVAERAFWKQYQHAYEEAIRHTAKPHAPWFVVPADDKWYMQAVVASALVSALAGLDLRYPEPDRAEQAARRSARAALVREGRRASSRKRP